MASIEERGESTRVAWLYGGGRGGAKQSCTFKGEPKGRHRLAEAAKLLVESRNHGMTRAEVYAAVLGEDQGGPEVVPTFKQWAQQWIVERAKSGDIQSDVVKGYEIALRTRAIPYLGGLKVTEITKDVLQAWVYWLQSSRATIGSRNKRESGRALHPNYIHRIYGVVGGCLAAAVPLWLPINPALRVRGSKDSVRLPKKIPYEGMFLSPAELDLVVENCAPDLQDLVVVAAMSGLRLGEILVLQSQHIVFPQGGGATILVRRARKTDGSIGQPKSKSSRRAVPVGPKAASILRRRCAGSRPSDAVFTTAQGKPWNQSALRQYHWYRAVAAAMRCADHPPADPKRPARGPRRMLRTDELSTCGCPGVLQRRPRFHDLRHTHASSLIEAGWSGKKLQKRLGHSDFGVTMNIYGHVLDLGTEEELATLDEYMDARPAPAKVAAQPRVVRQLVARSVQRRRRVA